MSPCVNWNWIGSVWTFPLSLSFATFTSSNLWISVNPVRRSPTPCGSTRAVLWQSLRPSWPLTLCSVSPSSQSAVRAHCLSSGTVSFCHCDNAEQDNNLTLCNVLTVKTTCSHILSVEWLTAGLNVCFRTGRCHGVALWMEYQLTNDITVSGGLIGPISEQVSPPLVFLRFILSTFVPWAFLTYLILVIVISKVVVSDNWTSDSTSHLKDWILTSWLGISGICPLWSCWGLQHHLPTSMVVTSLTRQLNCCPHFDTWP